MIISFTTYIAEQIISEVVLFAKFFDLEWVLGGFILKILKFNR